MYTCIPPDLFHKSRDLVLWGVEGGGGTHGGVHDLSVHIQILEQVLKLGHCTGDLHVGVGSSGREGGREGGGEREREVLRVLNS